MPLTAVRSGVKEAGGAATNSANSMSILNEEGGSSAVSKSTQSKSNGDNMMMSPSSSVITRSSSILSYTENNVCEEVRTFEDVEKTAQSPPPVKYRQTSVAKVINKRAQNISNNSNEVLQDRGKLLSDNTTSEQRGQSKEFSARLIDPEYETFVKTRPRFAPIEPKHETSV